MKNYNERGEMEIKKLAVSSSMKESLRAPTIWEKPASAMYDYHNQISGLYYQVSQEQVTSGSFNMLFSIIQRIVLYKLDKHRDIYLHFQLLRKLSIFQPMIKYCIGREKGQERSVVDMPDRLQSNYDKRS